MGTIAWTAEAKNLLARKKAGLGRAEEKRATLSKRLQAVLVAVAMIVGGMSALAASPAWAAEGGEHGDHLTFAEQLPMAEVHLDTVKLREAGADGLNMHIDNEAFVEQNGFIVLNQQMKSNTVYSFDGPVATFTFPDAAILPDGSQRDVYVALSDVSVHTGAKDTRKSSSTEDLLKGLPAIARVDGKVMSARVEDADWTEGSTNWRYGLEARVTISVPGIDGNFVYGLTGLTIDRSTTGSFVNIPDSDKYDYFSESAVIGTQATSAPVYYPSQASGYGAKVYEADGDLHFVGGGQKGGDKTGIDDMSWDDSFLAGFATEGNADNGLSFVFRCGAGVDGERSYSANSVLFPADSSYRFETSSSEGGTIEFTKNGGDLDDGSDILGPGHYSAPRGKSVRLTLTPDASATEGSYIRPKAVTVNGVDVTDQVARHRNPDRSFYYTYDMPAIFGATDVHVDWVDEATLTGSLDVVMTWDDGGDRDAKRPSLEEFADGFTLYRNGRKIEAAPVATRDGNRDTLHYDNLAVYADGSLIFYSASQTLPEGYEQTVAPITTTLSDSTGAWYGSMTITDTHEVETMSIAATKTWDDADFAALSDRGYTRPSSVSVRLTDDHGVTSDYEEATLSEANGWSHTWDNLPRYRVNEETQEREPIVYTVEETSKAKGYDVSYKVNGAAASSPAEIDASAIDAKADYQANVEIVGRPLTEDELKADIVLQKVDSLTGKNIAGVVFDLKDATGKVVATYTTGKTGIARISFDDVVTSGLNPKQAYRYTLVERTPAPGYQANDDKYIFTLKTDEAGNVVPEKVELKDGDSASVWRRIWDMVIGESAHADYDAEIGLLTVKNDPILGKVKVTKKFIDQHDKPLPKRALPEYFKIDVHFTTPWFDEGATEVQSGLTTRNGVYDEETGTYSWTIDRIVPGTRVSLTEENYDEASGYRFRKANIETNVDEAVVHATDASFTMPAVTTDEYMPCVDITNNYSQEAGFLYLVAEWQDENNKDKRRPKQVLYTIEAKTSSGEDVNVFENGTASSTLYVLRSMGMDDQWNRWEDVFPMELPVYWDGEPILYTVTERNAPIGYKVRGGGYPVTLRDGESTPVVVTHIHEPANGADK